MRLRDFLPPAWARKLARHRREPRGMRQLRRELQSAKILAAQTLLAQFRQHPPTRLAEAEFRVFSQFGDDGIIQYLLQRVPIDAPTFVEFGVEDYQESNTRFLLLHNNWRGLVMEANPAHVEAIRRDESYWRHDLTAVAAFIDCENINALLRTHGFTGSLGLLSIDIDGNDYWVWRAIDVAQPVIVIVEFNSVYGPQRAVAVPYDPRFHRAAAHFSHLYWGCSLRALCLLAEQKGYAFVGCNSTGLNAYFVRRDRLGTLPVLTAEAGYVESRFRDARDAAGRLTFLSGAARRGPIADLPLLDVERGATIRVRDL